MNKPRKEDIAGNNVYRVIARYSMGELHSNLMSSLRAFFSQRQGKHTLVVAGQGPEVVPYSRDLDSVEAMIGNGNIAMFDYNEDIIESSINALISPRFDDDEVVLGNNRKGVLERGYEFEEVSPGQSINLRDFGERRVIVRHGDLSCPFMFDDSSVSAFDATLAIHHSTAYKQGLEHVVHEVHRVLEIGGLFHWGDGIVNMAYQEEKIHQIAGLLQGYYHSDVALEDRRDPSTDQNEVVARAFYSKDLEYTQVPLVTPEDYGSKRDISDNPIRIQLTKEGVIRIGLGKGRDSRELKNYLLEMGFKSVHAEKSIVLLPLIDVGMTADSEKFLKSVENYYGRITELNNRIFQSKPDLAAAVYNADTRERSVASRGLFEYYREPGDIIHLLQGSGFRNVDYRSDSEGIWFNITALKE